jgi:hypothetical protein
MEPTVVYGTARTGDYLIVAMKKSQSVPFQGRHDCRLTTVCTNKTQRNTWGRAHGRQTLHSHPMQQKPFAGDSALLRKYPDYFFT